MKQRKRHETRISFVLNPTLRHSNDPWSTKNVRVQSTYTLPTFHMRTCITYILNERWAPAPPTCPGPSKSLYYTKKIRDEWEICTNSTAFNVKLFRNSRRCESSQSEFNDEDTTRFRSEMFRGKQAFLLREEKPGSFSKSLVFRAPFCSIGELVRLENSIISESFEAFFGPRGAMINGKRFAPTFCFK